MTNIKLIEKEFLKESNAIEGVYDRDSFKQAIYAWEYLKKQGELTPNVILRTHQILMKNHLPGEAGHFRRCQVLVGGHEGEDWHSIPESIVRWCSWAGKVFNWERIKLGHVEFERIHPFIDGNGRVGRMLMNWQRLKVEIPVLVIREAEKQAYYDWFDII